MNTLLVSTRKGLVELRQNSSKEYKPFKIHHNAEPISYTHVDERNGHWYAAIDHGHWGSKIQISKDFGNSWEEVDPPKYPEGEEVKEGVPASLRYIWAFANDGSNGTGIWLGTEPGGLFYSSEQGKDWTLNRGLWDQPSRKSQWFGGGRDHPGIHSIVVDPDNSDHIYIGISCAGVFESTDGGDTWAPKNKGLKADFLPDPSSEIGQDPHLLIAAPSNRDVMWQQNHCGIFVSEDGSQNWKDVSEDNGKAYFGFTIAVSENDPATAWVVPAVSDQTRTAIDHQLCVCRTNDLGTTWETITKGLPQEFCFDLVYRHALDITGETLVFGTTTGNVFISYDAGDSWSTLTNYYPMVHAVKFANVS